MSNPFKEFQEFKKNLLEKSNVKEVKLILKDGKEYTFSAADFFDQLKQIAMEGMMMKDHKEILQSFFLE